MLPFATFGMLALVLGTVWLPRLLLPRWHKVGMGMGMGMERGSSPKKVVVSLSEEDGLPSRGPLGEALGAGGEMRIGAASTLGGRVGWAPEEASRPSAGRGAATGVHGRMHEPRSDGRLRA